MSTNVDWNALREFIQQIPRSPSKGEWDKLYERSQRHLSGQTAALAAEHLALVDPNTVEEE